MNTSYSHGTVTAEVETEVEMELSELLQDVPCEDVLECLDTEEVLDALSENNVADVEAFVEQYVKDCNSDMKAMLKRAMGIVERVAPVPHHYVINVAKDGKHFFATAPHSLTLRSEAREVYDALCDAFATERYSITCTAQYEYGTQIDPTQEEVK